jgi:hypothetical protein
MLSTTLLIKGIFGALFLISFSASPDSLLFFLVVKKHLYLCLQILHVSGGVVNKHQSYVWHLFGIANLPSPIGQTRWCLKFHWHQAWYVFYVEGSLMIIDGIVHNINSSQFNFNATCIIDITSWSWIKLLSVSLYQGTFDPNYVKTKILVVLQEI